MSPRLACCLLLLASASTAGPASAAVVSASPEGFLLRSDASLATPPDKAYKALARIGDWWDSEHTYSGNSANLKLDARAGGCFCETLAGGGSVLHMTVLYAQPGKVLRLGGGLGPLQGEAASGVLTWTLAPTEGGTVMRQEYMVGGYTTHEGGWPDWAPVVDKVLEHQFQRYKRYAETGRP